MRKLFLLFLMFMLLAMSAEAAQLKQELIASTTLNQTTPTTSGYTYTGDAKRVSFFVAYDSSQVTTGVTVTVRAQISYDGTNWADMNWYDTAGLATPQTEEILDSDGTYAMWMPSAATPYIKITATMDNAAQYGSSEYGSIIVNVVKEE